MKKSFYILSAVLCVAVSCAKEMSVSDFSRPNVEKVSLYASLVDSKTALQEDLSVFWNAGDRLVVFGDSLHYFTAAEGGAASVKFDGNFCYSDSVTVDAATSMYALYPDLAFEGRDEVNGNVFDLFIENVQQPLSAGFDNVAAIVVGKVVGNEIPMRQVSALAKFTISSSDITSVQVRSASGVNIAGTLPVTIADDGSVTTGEAQLPTILVIPSSGKTFAPGTYYFNVAPAALTGGLEMRLTRASDDKVATKVGTNPVTFKRAQVMNFGTIDEGLTWTEIATTKILMNFVEVDEDGNFKKTEDDKMTFVHPFAIPSSFASSINNGTSKGVATTLVANADNGNLSYPAFSTAGFAKHAMGMRWGKGVGDYITIPKINGLTLQAVRVTYGGNASSYQPCGYLSITENGNPIAGGEMYKGFVGREDCAIWYIFSTDADKTYRMTCNQTAEVDFLRWEFLYSGTPEATVLGVLCSVEDAENSNATFKGSFSTYKDIEPDSYTCGFEYKTGAEDWTSIDADADFEFTYDVDFLTPGSEYTLRSWVDCGSGKYYSEPCVFTPTSVVKYTFDFVNRSEGDFESYGVPVTTSNPNSSVEYSTLLIAKENNNVFNLRYLPKKATEYAGIVFADQGLKFSMYGANSYIGFPAINGLTLNTIEETYGDVTGSSKHGIYAFNGTSFGCISHNKKNTTDNAYHNGSSPVSITANATTLFILSLEAATPYYLFFTSSKDKVNLKSLVLTYTGIELPTAQLIKAPQYTSGSLSAEVYFNSVTKASDITAGFEKETATPGEFVAVSSGTVGTLSSGRTTITGSASLTLGDVVRVWVSFDGGTTKYVGETTTIM